MSWIFFTTVTLIYIFSDRGFRPIPNYVMPSLFFGILSFSLYLGKVGKSQNTWFFILILTIGVLAFSFVSFFSIPDVYEIKTKVSWPVVAKIVLNLSLFLSIGFLVVFENTKSEKAMITLLVTGGFFSGAYGGGLAHHHFKSYTQPNTQFFYDYAPALNMVKVKRFDVCVEKWQSINHANRIIWVYSSYFDQVFPRNIGPEAKLEHDNAISNNIVFIKSIRQCEFSKGKFVLTDRPDNILNTFPGSKIANEFTFKDTQLFLVEKKDGAIYKEKR